MAEEQRPARFQNWKTVCASVGAVGLGYAAWRSTAMRDATQRWTEAFGNTAMDVGSQIMSAFSARVQHFQQVKRWFDKHLEEEKAYVRRCEKRLNLSALMLGKTQDGDGKAPPWRRKP